VCVFACTVVLAFIGMINVAVSCDMVCPDIYMPVCCINGGKNISFGNDCEAKLYEREQPGKCKL